MIRNERQYRITARQRQLLASALDEVAVRRRADEAIEPFRPDDILRFELEQASLEGQMSDLDAQLRAYEQLRVGALRQVRVTSLDQLPVALVQARIAAGLSQRDLAERLGLKEQQIQRYEAENYASASLSRLEAVRKALQVDIDADIALPASDSALQRLRTRLRQLGLDRRVIDNRLMRDFGDLVSPAKALAVAERAARLLGLTIQELLGPTDALPALATTARFKAPANASAEGLDAYTRYAEGLAEIVLKATTAMPRLELPASAQAMSRAVEALVAETGGKRTSRALFGAVVRYLFMHGVPVIALRDPGAFHGACFTNGGRSVIVLKQTTESTARWLYDLLHEVAHLRDAQRAVLRTWIELGDIEAWTDDPAEQAANDFAADVLFEGRAAPVIEACIARSGGSADQLKKIVPEVARQANVPADVLANYVAFQLSGRGRNWWPTAATFQSTEAPWRTVTDTLINYLDFTQLDSVERAALLDALAA